MSNELYEKELDVITEHIKQKIDNEQDDESGIVTISFLMDIKDYKCKHEPTFIEDLLNKLKEMGYFDNGTYLLSEQTISIELALFTLSNEDLKSIKKRKKISNISVWLFLLWAPVIIFGFSILDYFNIETLTNLNRFLVSITGYWISVGNMFLQADLTSKMQKRLFEKYRNNENVL